MKEVNIITLVDDVHKGDDANALATSGEIEKLFKSQEATVTSATVSQSDIESALNPSKYNIVVAAGEHHIATLCALKQNSSLQGKVYTSWSGHQTSETLSKAASIIDSIALPTHVLGKESRNILQSRHAKLIETVGVAHDTKPEDLLPQYEKWSQSIIESNKYDMVVLGGDAPDEKGDMHYYTSEEAFNLGQYIGLQAIESGAVVLGTNGPRTGKHNPDTGEVLLSHRELHPETKEPLDYQLDAVSMAFVRGLEKSGLVKGKNFQFFDFKFGKDGVVSAYQGLLGATVAKVGSHVYMPGESTSMVSEACDLLPNGSVTVFDNGAMSGAHMNHIDSVYTQGYTHRLSTELALSPQISREVEGKDMEARRPLSAAATVARSVFDTISAISREMHEAVQLGASPLVSATEATSWADVMRSVQSSEKDSGVNHPW